MRKIGGNFQYEQRKWVTRTQTHGTFSRESKTKREIGRVSAVPRPIPMDEALITSHIYALRISIESITRYHILSVRLRAERTSRAAQL